MSAIPVQPFHTLSEGGGRPGITCSCGQAFTDRHMAMEHQTERDREAARFNERRPALAAAIDALNRLHQTDPKVLPALIEYRVPCNRAVADDPSIQVNATPCLTGVHDRDHYEVGFLGVLNGIFGVDARNVGYLAAVCEEGKLLHFEWKGA